MLAAPGRCVVPESSRSGGENGARTSSEALRNNYVTGKERVTRAINLQLTDRVPLGFYVVDYDTIERVIGRKTFVRNKIATQIALWEGRREEVVESYKRDTVEFFRKVDVVDLITFKEAPFVPPKDYDPDPPRRVSEDTWEHPDGRLWKISELSNDIVCFENPHARDTDYTVQTFEQPVKAKPPDPSVFEACDYIVEHLGRDRYIAGASGGLTAMVLLGGMERGLMEYVLRPDLVRAATRHSVDSQNAADKWAIRPGQDGVLLEQDMASTKGPMISPAMFREFCFPAMSERVQRIRSRGQQVILHNCGNNRLLVRMFIEAGVQCYQSLQSIPDMEIGSLKAEFGDRLCLWGGIALENLIQGTTQDVRRNVRNALARGAPGGGFILGPSHSIAKGTKYDNFMALLDEFARWADRY